MKIYNTPEKITKLKKNEIFVFGSNLNGSHAGGAALQAVKFGAVEGVGEGLTGQTYAFPTLDKKMKKVSSTSLKKSVENLYKCAKENEDKTFYVTKVGTGIAGYTEEEMKAAKLEVQKELNQLFTGLQNPTLPSAYKLRDAAVANGFAVEPKIQHRLQQADGMWV